MKKFFLLCLFLTLLSKVLSMENTVIKKGLSEMEISLLAAIRLGNYKDVRSLIIDKKVNPFFLIENKKTLLHEVFAGSTKLNSDVINLLVNLFSNTSKKTEIFNVNCMDFIGTTPLHMLALKHCCKKRNDYVVMEETLKALKKSGANFDARTKEGKTPLDLASLYCGKTMLLFVEMHPNLTDSEKRNYSTFAIKLLGKNCSKRFSFRKY